MKHQFCFNALIWRQLGWRDSNIGHEFERPNFNPGQVAQLVGVLFVHQKVVGLIPSQGTYLGHGFNPRLGHAWEATD